MFHRTEYPSTLYHECNDLPGELLSKFTSSEEPNEAGVYLMKIHKYISIYK